MKKITINYLNEFKELEIQSLINYFESNFINALTEKFDFYYVRRPFFSIKKLNDEIKELRYSRAITFDTVNDYQIYNLYNFFDYWFINKISSLELENNHGIFSKLNYLLRDKLINVNSSLEQNIIFIEMRSDNEDDIVNKIYDIGKKIYGVIYDIFQSIHLYNRKVNTKIPKPDKVIFFNNIQNNKSSSSYLSLINEKTLKYGVISTLEWDHDDDFNDILNKNQKVNFYYFSKHLKNNIKFIEISIRNEKEEILKKINQKVENNLEFNYLKSQIENFKYKTINIQVNLDYILLLLLNKASVFEIQANQNNNDIQDFIDKSKLKTLE